MDAVTVVGAGGIGCAVGAAWAAAGSEVTFVEPHPGKRDHGRRHGVQVVGSIALPANFVHPDEWTPAAGERIFLCVKCYDNPAALAKIPADAELIPVQNGFDPQLDARPHRFEGIASFVSECDPDRPVTRITRPGKLHIGPRSVGHETPHFPSSSVRVERVAEILPYKYTKLMYNAAVSPLAAAAGIDNGKLLSDPFTRELFFALLRENHAIITAAGVRLGTIGPVSPGVAVKILRKKWLSRLLAKFFEPSLRGTYCSMAGEIQEGRTELDNYTGHLIRLAGDATPCPVNRAVYALVSRMTRDRSPSHPGVLREIAL